MKILALDPATYMGFAIGHAGGDVPESGTVRLKKRDEGPDVAAFNALCFLRDKFVLDKPDLVACEAILNPAGQKSADAIILQLMVYGVIAATCRAYRVRFEHVGRTTILKHFIGVGRTGDRQTTKREVLKRAKALRYIPADCSDDNRADACALFDYASAHFARTQPRNLVLFGETFQ